MNPLSTLRRLFLGAAVFGLLAAGASARAEGGWFSSSRLVGSGKIASEARQVVAFQGIYLQGAMDLRVRQSSKDAVEVRGDDNVLPLVETTVVDRDGIPTLELRFRKGASFTTQQKVVVTVEVAMLKRLAISGSGDAVADGIRTAELRTSISGAGDMRLNQLDAGSLSVAVSGSGDVAATGRAGNLRIAISGSGDVVTRELQADDVKVSIAGSGDARVQARRTLAVSIAGSGDVAYTGDATPTVSVVGSGSVKKL